VSVFRRPLAFRLFVLLLIAGLTLPRMWQRGMFGDGLLYATIARNLSVGIGSFWAPSFTHTRWPEFFEHPPLGFALEGGAFWILGDSLVVERAYSLAMLAIHAFVIAMLWRRLLPAKHDWLPLLFWILPSIVVWGVINNMLENAQALFTSTAVLLAYHACRAARARSAVLWSGAAAVAIVAAVLIKGPVGFFPLVAPAALLLLPRTQRPDLSRLALVTFTLVAALGVIAAGLFAYEPSHRALSIYLQTQVVPALQGHREIADDARPMVRFVGNGIVLRMSVLAAILWAIGRYVAGARTRPAAPTRWFLALGVCASLPLGVSPKLSGHYFLPCVPFFALGFASLIVGQVDAASTWLTGRATHRTRRIVGAIAVTLALAITIGPLLQARLRNRDVALLGELDAIAAAMPRGETIGLCTRTARSDWQLEAYVNRFYRVTLDPRDVPVNGWWLQADRTCVVPPVCTVAARGDLLALYRCQS
jgi:4-amino-4-deoxy-L-arabinose transferase-like glycosyltransferase